MPAPDFPWGLALNEDTMKEDPLVKPRGAVTSAVDGCIAELETQLGLMEVEDPLLLPATTIDAFLTSDG